MSIFGVRIEERKISFTFLLSLSSLLFTSTNGDGRKSVENKLDHKYIYIYMSTSRSSISNGVILLVIVIKGGRDRKAKEKKKIIFSRSSNQATHPALACFLSITLVTRMTLWLKCTSWFTIQKESASVYEERQVRIALSLSRCVRAHTEGRSHLDSLIRQSSENNFTKLPGNSLLELLTSRFRCACWNTRRDIREALSAYRLRLTRSFSHIGVCSRR